MTAMTHASPRRFSWNGLIRQSHRWISLGFTLTVIANFIALGMGYTIDLITYAPLLPLFLLLFSGLYMFALPHVGKWRRR